MARFKDCVCQETGCYQCAVGFVISSLGFDPSCDCFGDRGRPCGNRCNRMFPDWMSAFDRCVSPYREWAKRRSEILGLVVVRKVAVEEDEGASIATPMSDCDSGFVVFLEQDVERAAEEIALDANTDPISFDAAGLIVSNAIKKTGSVPSALRDWAASVLSGETKRPIARGKIPRATIARDKMIFQLLSDVVKSCGLKPTSSNRECGKSACHAVAEAFALLGLEPRSYQAMVKIWEDRKTLNIICTSDD